MAGRKVPTLDVAKHVLTNGMQIYIVEERSAPIFCLQLWYRVGSADEREAAASETHGTTGLSHFFEHMMFRGTERYPDFFDAVYQRGGQLNAWTWLDTTCYWEKLPLAELEFVLELEADRLANMRLDFLNLEPEREVVKNERLLRTEDDPSGAASEQLHRIAYTTHPYRWPTVGSMHDICQVSIEEAEAYFRPRYSPSNLFAVLVGDVSADAAIALFEAHFGGLSGRGDGPVRERAQEPLQQQQRRQRVEKPVQAPLFQLAWHAPVATSRDFVVLEVADYMLVRGKSSRLQRALVFGDNPVATHVSASLFPMRDPYLYQWEISVSPDRSAREAEALLLAELEKLATEPPNSREVEKAVNGLSADLVRASLSCQGKAQMLGFSIIATDDPLAFVDRLEAYRSVRPEEIQAAIAKWLPRTRSSQVAVTPVDGPEALVGATFSDEEDEPGTLLRESMGYAGRRLALSRTEQTLDGEALAIQSLARRCARALAQARAADDASLSQKIQAYEQEEQQGPNQRTQRLERSRTESAASRLEVEQLGEDLRERLPSLRAAHHGPRDVAVLAACAGYLGCAGPALLEQTLPELDPGAAQTSALTLLAAHLWDLSNDMDTANHRYGAITAQVKNSYDRSDWAVRCADLAWERMTSAVSRDGSN